ncbi:MAG: response regulator [Candidatus Omnitrophica bacterium]|nr:Chemotaxis response regulator protein-glutamate methylesterase [bacterium]NUN97096.1 response regulator [Candidatus Omnitrophota bacterium]
MRTANKHDWLTKVEPPSPSAPKPPRILVVDDEETIREMLSETLSEAASYEVDTAADGREALQKMRSSHFDLVITDLRMPEMDGARLLDIARHEFPEIPIVVITGFARLETAIESLRLGAANFITKPFRLSEILDVIDKSIKRKRAREIPQRVLPCLFKEEIVFHIPPNLDSKSGVIHYLTEKLVGVGICDESARYFVSVSLDEALTNAIFYGCLELPSGLRETESGTEVFNRLVSERLADPQYNSRAITVEMDLSPERVIYRITDPGPGFDPPDLRAAPIEPTELSRLHGRGLLLISCFMDEVWYNERGTQITMVKRPSGGRGVLETEKREPRITDLS